MLAKATWSLASRGAGWLPKYDDTYRPVEMLGGPPTSLRPGQDKVEKTQGGPSPERMGSRDAGMGQTMET